MPPRSAEALAQGLRSLMQAETQACDTLSGHLTGIAEALARGQTEYLGDYLRHEAELLQQLDDLNQKKHGLLVDSGFTADLNGLVAALHSCDAPDLHQLWQDIGSKLKNCRERNRSNAAIVKQTQLQVQAALHSLSGQAVAGTDYTADGQVRDHHGQRKLGEA